MVAGGDVRKGDRLVQGGGDTAKERVVAEVRRVAGRGLYNPQTLHGDIVVDGMLVSTYTKTVPPQGAHALLTPLRAVYKAVSIWLGDTDKVQAAL